MIKLYKIFTIIALILVVINLYTTPKAYGYADVINQGDEFLISGRKRSSN